MREVFKGAKGNSWSTEYNVRRRIVDPLDSSRRGGREMLGRKGIDMVSSQIVKTSDM